RTPRGRRRRPFHAPHRHRRVDPAGPAGGPGRRRQQHHEVRVQRRRLVRLRESRVRMSVDTTDSTTAEAANDRAQRIRPPRIPPPLLRYVLIRVGISILLIWGVTIVTFLLTNLVPTDPVAAILGDRAAADPEIVAQTRQRLGLDEPLIVQYFTYLSNLLHGDLGVSNQTRVPVLESIGQVFPASIELGIGAIVISVLLGLM